MAGRSLPVEPAEAKDEPIAALAGRQIVKRQEALLEAVVAEDGNAVHPAGERDGELGVPGRVIVSRRRRPLHEVDEGNPPLRHRQRRGPAEHAGEEPRVGWAPHHRAEPGYPALDVHLPSPGASTVRSSSSNRVESLSSTGLIVTA